MSTETSVLDLILRIRKGGIGDKEAIDAFDKLRKKTKETKDENAGLVQSLTDIKAGFDLASQAVAYIGQAYDATIGQAVRWGDAMGDLSQLTGTSVRETSEFAATMELLGIKSDGLTKVIKAFTAQGLQPTMENVRKLAAEYQAIQDPVERNEFLFKRFGKQAGDVAEVLGKTTADLDRFTAAARTSGKVIDEDMANAAERLGEETAILQQKWEGLLITLGNTAVPVLNDAADGLNNLVGLENAVMIWVQQHTGAIDDQTAAYRAQLAASGDWLAAYREMPPVIEENRDGLDRLTTSTATAQIAINSYSLEVVSATQNNYDAAAAAAANTAALDTQSIAAATLAGGLKDLSAETLFNQAAAGLDSVAALELATKMGLIDEKAATAAGAMQELRNKYDLDHDGAISAAEGAAQFAKEAENLANKLNLIPTRIDTVVTVTTQGDTGQILTNSSVAGAGNQITTRRAAGGPVLSGMPVLVGESGPEMFIPQQSGWVVNNYNLSLMQGGTSQGVMTDFALMRALAGV